MLQPINEKVEFVKDETKFGDRVLSKAVTIAFYPRNGGYVEGVIYPGGSQIHDNFFVLANPITRFAGRSKEEVLLKVPLAIERLFQMALADVDKANKRVQEIREILPLAPLSLELDGPLPEL